MKSQDLSPSFPNAGVTSTCDHVQLLMWVLEIQTQVFVLAEQVPLPLNLSSYAPYTLFFKTESLSEPRSHRFGKTSWASKPQGLSQLCLSGAGVVGMSCSAWLCICMAAEDPTSGPSVASALFYQLNRLPGPCCFPREPDHLSGLWPEYESPSPKAHVPKTWSPARVADCKGVNIISRLSH